MKYYLINPYNKTVCIRNTYTRMVAYIRSWNLKHPYRNILRGEIREARSITLPVPTIWNRVVDILRIVLYVIITILTILCIIGFMCL